MIKLNDRLYGQQTITEPVLVDLIESSSMQRLAGVDQAGYFTPFIHKPSHSRLEHCIGVCLLLREYGAPLEEQVAGLLHDVSHSAFSHCIDYALDEGSEERHDHQDNIHESFLQASEIPSILERYGYDPKRIVNEHNFPLLEQPSPDLCADRIDYVLRQAVLYDEETSQGAQDLLATLSAEDGKWIFRDVSSARSFAHLFRTMNETYYCGVISAAMLRTVGDYLKHGLKQGYITRDDLYTTDKQVLDTLAAHHEQDSTLKQLFARMNNEVPYTITADERSVTITCKSRAVDPLCRSEAGITRLSDLDPEWKAYLLTALKPIIHHLRFEDTLTNGS